MRRFLNGFKYAASGIRSFFASEANGRIQGVIALVIIALSIFLGISLSEWVAVLLCIALVICLEMVNSAIEKLCNLITTEYNPAVKTIKDMAAGAVLMAAIVTAIIGTTIFLPYVLALFR